MAVISELSGIIREIAVSGFKKKEDYTFDKNPLLEKLKCLGSQLWMDTGDREAARPLWKKELSALTTNNTLANQVVQTGVMDDAIKQTISKIRTTGSEMNEDDLIIEIGFIINCKIALRLVEAFNAKVSVELHPAMSRNIEKSVIYGKRYYDVCPEHFIIKVPLTPEGYVIAQKLARDEIPVNFTLGFSARQNYLAARLSNPAYVNVFLGRLNQVVLENSLGTGKYVGEKVTLATQSVLDETKNHYSNIKTRLIGASVRNGQQVIDLAGIDVLTIPPKAVQEVYDSGIAAEEITSNRNSCYEVGINNLERFQTLWEVPDNFKGFTDRLLKTDVDELTGDALVTMSNDNNINLFYPFNSDELKQIKDHGKIPRLADWDKGIAMDDLMTQSAIQSFAKDQEALDNRIKGFL
jgi:transaldolase